MPESVDLKNNKTARDSMEFVKSEVNKLLENGCVVEVKDKPIVINPLTVATNKVGKQRLVLDCCHLNKCLQKFNFKYEDAIEARRLFEKGTYLFSFNLRSAYHHIDIFSQHRTYLGFKLIKGETTKYFIFHSLPFSLATAGFIFTKLLRLVVQYWRSAGHQVVMFLDDGICGNTNRDKAVKSGKFIKGTLDDLGFLIAEDKCKWDPVLQAVWLGYFWNMVEGKLYVTDERVSRLEKSLQSLLSTVNACKVNLVRVRFLACIVGQVICMQAVFGKIVQLKTRSLYKCIQSRASWDAPVSLTAEGIKELEYWKQNVRAVNQKGQTTVKSRLSERRLSETTGLFKDDGQSRTFYLLSIAIKLPIIRISIIRKIQFFEVIRQSRLKKLLLNYPSRFEVQKSRMVIMISLFGPVRFTHLSDLANKFATGN